MANRYMELIYVYQSMLKRELTIDEIQFIKWIVAKEFDHQGILAADQTSDASLQDAPVLCGTM